MTAVLAGLGTGLALIVAIGAQNAYLLRQAVRRQHAGVVAAICIVADMSLIAVGTAGVAAVINRHPQVLAAVTWAGAAYLVWFAIGSFRRAGRSDALTLQESSAKGSVVATTLAITFLNPHVYLDTVVMLGSIANSFDEQRWLFAGGAMLGSVAWFSLLALGARALARPLANPRTWRILDIAIGLMMLGLAAKLVLG